MPLAAPILLALLAPLQAEPPQAKAPLVVHRGEGLDPLRIPADEELEYQVEIDVGILGDLGVGSVTIQTGLEPYSAGLPDPGVAAGTEPARFVGWIRSRARGSYLGYELNHELETRHLPQEWPSVLHRSTQAGSEHRRRELRLGLVDGKRTAIFRSDGHCKGCESREHFVESNWAWGKPHHCKKCKRGEHRVWSEPQRRDTATGAVDMLTAVYLARSMIQEGREQSTFPVVDKRKQWLLTVSRGPTKSIATPAGKFRCALAQLESRVPAGEKTDTSRFEGLFGIQGSIKIWMEVATGIPVLITGELPVPVISTLDLNVSLRAYRGTPAAFHPER